MNSYNNGLIYKIETPDKYFYYGSTINTLDLRIKAHKSSFNSKYKSDLKLYKKLTQHKWEDLKFTVVENYQCNNRQELLEQENYYIKQYIKDSFCLNTILSSADDKQKTMYTCEFCNKNFKTIITLTTHKKINKKCLTLRNDKHEVRVYLHKCDCCEFSTNIKNAFKTHQLTCNKTKVNKEVKKYENIINELKQQYLEEKKKYENIILELQEKNGNKILELERRVEKNNNLSILKDSTILKLKKNIVEYKDQLNDLIKTLASKPNITNNTTTNNKSTNDIQLSIINLDTNYVKEKVDNNFTLEHLNNGQKGLAKFTKDHILQEEEGKTKYICTDASRNFFKYKDQNGLVKKDIRASKLTEAIKDPIISKSQILFSIEQEKLIEMANNRSTTSTESDSCYLQLGLLAKSFFEMKEVGQNNIIFSNELSLLYTK
jgi:hypothetical protein